MSGISTHILDTSLGTPAAGVPIELHRLDGPGPWALLATAHTDADGRVQAILPVGSPLTAGTYRLRFETGAYMGARAKGPPFYPQVEVTFTVADPSRHHHIPLLISPFGYTTYRGS